MTDNCLYIAVCDDDELICEAICVRLEKILTSCGMRVNCDKYVSPELLYKNTVAGTRKYDIIFLDIDMPKITGIELAKALRKAGYHIDIVFVSNREDKVFDTFAVQPFGFIRKNNFSHDLNDTLRLYISTKVINDSTVVLRTANNSVTRTVKVSEIVYIESFKYKQFVYLASGEKIEILMTMKELENKLKEYDVVRVHQGYLVNFKFVQRISRTEIILNYDNGRTLGISREKTQELKALYLNYLRKTGAVVFDDVT